MASFAVLFFSTFEICALIALQTGHVSLDYIPFSATWVAVVILKAIVVFLGNFSKTLRVFCLLAAVIVCMCFIMIVAQQLGFVPKEYL